MEVIAKERPLTLSNRTIFIVSGILIFAALIPVWMNQYFPSQNGSLYLTVVQIVKEYSNPRFNYSDLYHLSFVIVPNLTFLIVTYLLALVFPIVIANKIAISIMLILLPVSLFYFIRAVDSAKIFWGFIIFVYLHNFYLYKGYDNYYLSFSIFLFYFGYLYKHRNTLNKKNYAVLFILALLIYLSHMFTFLLAVFITFLFALLTYRESKQIIKLGMVFLLPFLLFLYYVYTLFSNPISSFGGHQLKYDAITKVVQDFIDMNMYSFSRIPVYLMLIPLSFLVVSIIIHLIHLRREYLSKKESLTFIDLLRREKMLVILVSLVILFLLAPRMIIGWGKFNVRFLPFILFFMIVSAQAYNPKIIRIFLGITVIASLINYSVITHFVQKVGKDFDDYTSGIPYVEMNKNILPLHVEDYHVGNIRPLHFAFNYYTIRKGGATWKNPVFKLPGRIPISYKEMRELWGSPSANPLNPQRPGDANLEKIREVFDYILVWGTDTEIFKLIHNLQYDLIHSKGKLRLYARDGLQ